MSEYIVRETGYPGTIKQDIVQELVRCKDCKHYPIEQDRDGWVEWPKYEYGFTDDVCPYYCEDGYYSKMPPEDGFCHKGEKQ